MERRDPPISLRVSGALADRLAIRSRHSNPSLVAKQDLIDLWRLLDHDIPTFSPAETRLLMDALNSTYLGIEMAHLLWASVDDACEDGQLGETWDVDCAALVARLRALDRLDAIRVVRAVAFAWDCISAGQDVDAAIQRAGLVGRH